MVIELIFYSTISKLILAIYIFLESYILKPHFQVCYQGWQSIYDYTSLSYSTFCVISGDIFFSS